MRGCDSFNIPLTPLSLPPFPLPSLCSQCSVELGHNPVNHHPPGSSLAEGDQRWRRGHHQELQPLLHQETPLEAAVQVRQADHTAGEQCPPNRMR